jgi:hypothetical protein
MTPETQAVVKQQRRIRWWLIMIIVFVSSALAAGGVLAPMMYEHLLEDHFDFYDRFYSVSEGEYVLLRTFNRAIIHCDGDIDCPRGLSCVTLSRGGPRLCEIKCLRTSLDCPEAMACIIESHGRNAATCQLQKYLRERPRHGE